MRPGPNLIRAIAAIAIIALLVPVATWMIWIVASSLLIVAVIATVEALSLRRVQLIVERPAKLALPLGESDSASLRIATSASRPLRIHLRQRWPELVSPRSVSRDAICRPGESVSLELDLRGVARGTAPIDPAYAAF